MPGLDNVATKLLDKVTAYASDEQAAITQTELDEIKTEITKSSHPLLLAESLQRISDGRSEEQGRLDPEQVKILCTHAQAIVNARAANQGSTFDTGLDIFNQLNRLNPVSWLFNGHPPGTVPKGGGDWTWGWK